MRNKIYIADDNESNLEGTYKVIGILFPKYETTKFENGRLLYKNIEKNYKNLKLVLTDNEMPLMNGLDVIKESASKYKEIPFILMSGRDIKESALEAGAKEFIEKPLDMKKIKSALSKYLVD